ncbi:hypothetical protein F5Y09DRAFT_345685 [Xylaria sp. FL1042]|nr:hypothetical protein F5Y09DRAFT_345685 [Xylaria sp. FL1042]
MKQTIASARMGRICVNKILFNRLQNRISQRNHRLRVQNTAQSKNCIVDIIPDPAHQKGDQPASSDRGNIQVTPSCSDGFEKPGLVSVGDTTTAPFYTISSTLAPPSSDAMIPLMAEDLVLQQLPAWSHVDSVVGMPMPMLNEDHASHFEPGFASNNCTCNETTGPCPGHIEKMRAQVLGETSRSLQSHQQHRSHSTPRGETALPQQEPSQTPLSRNSFSQSNEPHQPQPFHRHNSIESSSSSSNSSTYLRLSAQSPPNMPFFGVSSSSMSSHAPLSGDFLPGKVSTLEGCAPDAARLATAHSTSEADMTRRFVAIFNLVQSLGFKHFDEMVVAYYTAAFEKESLPAMARSASRSRRLKPMLQQLQGNSFQWPRWESRGLREGILEAATCTYVAEMEAQGRAREPSQLRNESVPLIAAIERLLREHGWGRQDDMSRPHDWEGITLSEQVDAAPDSMPCLWTLLTELAGAQGLYCDRVARAALAILLSAPS